LLLGGFSLSLIEGNMRLQTPTLQNPTLPPTTTPTGQPSPSLEDSPTPPPRIWTPTLPPSPTNCPPPSGWLPYIVQPGDSLDGLAIRVQKTSPEISQANCLVSSALLPGLIVYLPPLPTRTPVSCGAPYSWVIYIVQQGDTLYHLGQVYGIPFMDIQRANCLASSIIHIGQLLYVPPWATRTPSPTPFLFYDTPSATWTDTPTGTATADTITPADTATLTPSDTPTSDGY
jgi:LysM repeat protein